MEENITTKLVKIGGELAIEFNEKMLKALNIDENAVLEIKVKDGNILITPVKEESNCTKK